MDCKDVQNRIEAYLDGELTLSDRRDFEEHLTKCKNCNVALENLRMLNRSVQKLGYVHSPSALRKNIKAGLRDITGEEGPGFNWPQLLGFGGATAAMASIAMWLVMSFMIANPMQATMTDELIAAHVRSLMVDHATDIKSSDSHTVKPWFNGKLDFSPVVKDFASQGFPLLGGRLEYLQQQPVAALVYQRRSHMINVFINRSAENDQTATLHELKRQGYTILNWRKQGLEFRVISDLNAKELKQFSTLLNV